MGTRLNARDLIARARLIFWDFDGVVKESVDIKTQAYVRLFESYGAAVMQQVRAHHEANGGMTRFEKFPLYLRLAGEEPTEDRVSALCDRFSGLVKQAVIDSPWVPGAEAYIRRNPNDQKFALLSASPQNELDEIVNALDLRKCFLSVVGAPTSKIEGLQLGLRDLDMPPKACLMIGDARADMNAALAVGVPFLLRRHATNAGVFRDYDALAIEDFTSA